MIGSAIKYNHTQISRRGNPLRFQGISKKFKLLRAALFLIIIGLLVLAYWIFLTPTFAIETIEIRGTFVLPENKINALLSEQIARSRWYLASQNNIFAFDAKMLSNTVAKQFAIENIEIKKKLPRAVIITVLEKPRTALWSSRGIAYGLDAEGIITGIVNLTVENNKQFIIYNKSGGAPDIGAQALSAATMRFLSDLITNNAIKSLNPQFAMVENEDADYVIIKFSETGQSTHSWSAYFSISDSPKKQIDNLELVLRNSIPPNKRQNLDYIDLRFGDRVYYK